MWFYGPLRFIFGHLTGFQLATGKKGIFASSQYLSVIYLFHVMLH